MKPHSQNEPETGDLFCSQLDQVVNPRYEIAQLANNIDRVNLATKAGEFFTDEDGSPPFTLNAGLTHI